MDKVSLIIGADIVPTKANYKIFREGNVKDIVGEALQQLFDETDFRVFNLETPICDLCTPIKKTGPILYTSPAVFRGISAMYPSVLTLANNHIMDCGSAGYESTIRILDENKIMHIGAGENLEQASRPQILEKNGIKIGLYACAEHEFSIAGENFPGANPFDPLNSLDHIQQLKSNCDHVVVLYHGGKEYYRYPSPLLQKVCRKMVEKGADVVVCQHSHCVGSYEKYLSGTILYGQGNFIFNDSENEYEDTSLLLRIVFEDKMSIEFIPIKKDKHAVRMADETTTGQILKNFNMRSNQILQNGFVERQYNIFAESLFEGYLKTFLGSNILFRIFNKLSGHKLIYKYYSKEKLLPIRNYIECEAHREIIIANINHRVNPDK